VKSLAPGLDEGGVKVVADQLLRWEDKLFIGELLGQLGGHVRHQQMPIVGKKGNKDEQTFWCKA